MIDQTTLADFERFLWVQIPGCRVAYKDKSKLMRFLGFLLNPFNNRFMESCVTTWGSKIYFPSQENYRANALGSFMTLAHEYVHLWDSKERGFWKFHWAYISPQVYFLLPLLAYAVLGSLLPLLALVGGYVLSAFIAYKSRVAAIISLVVSVLGTLTLGWFLSGFWTLLLPAAILLLFLSSSGRTKLELRGYSMNIATLRWLFNQEPTPEYYDAIRAQFTGPSYLFMSWSKASVENSLQSAIKQAAQGSLQSEGPYLKVYEFLEFHGHLAAR